MPAFRTIADNLAARYAPGVLATPTGALAIRESTAALPNAIGPTPCVLVVPDAGTFDIPSNGSREGAADWLVRMYYGQSAGEGLERDSVQLLDWLSVLVDVLGTDLDLASTVVVARTMGWRVGTLSYAGVTFTGLELRVHTVLIGPWTPTP